MAASTIDLQDALDYARLFEKRIGDSLFQLLREKARNNQLTLEETLECIQDTLECATASAKSEALEPDYELMREAMEDFKQGRWRTARSIVHELQGSGT